MKLSLSLVQETRAAVALAAHVDRADQNLGPIIYWKSSDPILEQSITMLEIPAQPSLDPIIEKIRAACDGDDFKPLKIIQVVNALQPLGKENAIAKIEEFIAIKEKSDPYARGIDNLFWILRILFEPIELGQRIPVPRAVIRSVEAPLGEDWPLNPIIVVDDIPFRYVGGGMGGTGMPEHPKSHIAYVKRYCVIRDDPLIPQGDPVLTAQQLIESGVVEKMQAEERAYLKQDIMRQSLKLLPKDLQIHYDYKVPQSLWLLQLERAQNSPLKWTGVDGFIESTESDHK